MPLYEYRCQSCGDEFETIQKFSDRPLTRCKKCHGKLEKLFSRSSFLLKGGGWYSDGYHQKAGSKPVPKPGGSAKTESAPAKKTGSD